jgi:type IV pilus assembly protein PilB
MASLKQRLKEILLRDKLISPQDFQKAIEYQKDKGGALSEVLVKLKLIDEDALTQVLSEGLQLPVINITHLKIAPDVIDLIPKETAIKYQIMPISVMGNYMTLAMVDPLNIFVIDDIKFLTGYTINPIISRPSDIEATITRYYMQDEEKKDTEAEAPEEENGETFDEIIQDIQDTEDLELVKEENAPAQQKQEVEEIADEAPIIKLTDTIIRQSVYAKASDVFIEPMEACVRVRYRVDGVIREVDRITKALHFPIVSRIKIISNLDISEHRLPQDGRFKIILSQDKSVDFRVNILPTAFGEKVCLRVLDQSGEAINIDTLGFEEQSLERLKECADKPHGLILACGPTGSGKTTTLYSILKYVSSPEKNLVTVEDPVEYQMKGANQVNVKPSMGLTFARSLRSILRQDPDVILIGEIRDSETLDIAVKAALTGHLVLSSLHTTTAAGSIVRMENMGIEPFLICSSLLAIVAQRLIRRICPHCKEAYEVSDVVIEKMNLRDKDTASKVVLFRGKGCSHCFKTGYQGRVGITEILVLSPTVKELILNRSGEIRIKAQARREGMKTMREDGLAKAKAGLTTIEEVVRITAPDEPLIDQSGGNARD